MADSKPWDKFMMKEYEEAWTYIRYTYDMSNRMMWYLFGIIVAVGAIAGKLLVVKEIAGPSQIEIGICLLNPSRIDIGKSYYLGFIFLVLFLGGLCMHAFITFQRVIIDRQVMVISHIREYFIEQAQPVIDIAPFLFFKQRSIPKGYGDLIAQTRLMLPVLVNAATGTLSLIFFLRIGWEQVLSFLLIFLFLIASQFYLVNQLLYKVCVRRLVENK